MMASGRNHLHPLHFADEFLEREAGFTTSVGEADEDAVEIH